ncbi:MAG TPA: efflux RND transporter periplasmic adaptor subunit [Reyranella sp.]|nr:efflux RND transporter periplasmic adaptor subunit [Reyranella sp.]
MRSRAYTGLIALSLLTTMLAGCKPENKFIAPPTPEVAVALPLKQKFTPFIELTGNTQAFNNVDLVARVEGFLTAINYKDGSAAKKGDLLFEIDPSTYEAKVKQAEAELASAKAQLENAQAEYNRQETLLRQNVSAQNTFDMAKAKRDSAAANVQNQDANLTIAKINLGYTKVMAPFDSITTRHLISVGEVVGSSTNTKLATSVQLDPMYVMFNVSEQDVLNIRANLKDRRISLEEINKVPLDVGLMTEEGFPHKGHLNYVSPDVDPTTGTIQLRGLFDNPNRALLPGFFVRVRMPLGLGEREALIVPDQVISEDQAGKYLLVVNKDDTVEQRRITTGSLLPGSLRVIDKGLNADDRVVISTNGRAIPGRKIVPKSTTIAAPAAK